MKGVCRLLLCAAVSAAILSLAAAGDNVGKSSFYRGREGQSRFPFAVHSSRLALGGSRFVLRGSHSFVNRISRSRFVLRGSHSFVNRISRSRFVLRGSQFVVRSSHSAVRNPRFALRGSYSAVRTPRFALRGSYSAVRTPRFALRGSHSAVRTPRFVLRGSHSAVSTPRCGFRFAVRIRSFSIRTAHAHKVHPPNWSTNRTAECEPRSTNRGVRTAECGPRSANRGVRTANRKFDCKRVGTAEHEPRTGNSIDKRVGTAEHEPRTIDKRVGTNREPPKVPTVNCERRTENAIVLLGHGNS